MAWLVVLGAGIPNLQRASDAFSQDFSVPGREGFETNRDILERFGADTLTDAIVPVVALPAGTSATAARDELAEAEASLREALPGALVAGYGSTGDRAFVSADGRTTFVVVYPRFRPDTGFDAGLEELGTARETLRAAPVAGSAWNVTGYEALQDSSESGSDTGVGVLVEALVGGLGALVVLAFVFASFLALVPLITALFSIVATFMVMWAITTVAEVSFIVTFLVALIGLGVCIDYALLLVMRWREERAGGVENERAVENAMATAGSAIVFSGTTVGIGLLALVVLPVPFLRSIGYAGMLIPLVSVAVAVTLLPVLLATVGPRLDWPRIRSERDGSRFWLRVGAVDGAPPVGRGAPRARDHGAARIRRDESRARHRQRRHALDERRCVRRAPEARGFRCSARARSRRSSPWHPRPTLRRPRRSSVGSRGSAPPSRPVVGA